MRSHYVAFEICANRAGTTMERPDFRLPSCGLYYGERNGMWMGACRRWGATSKSASWSINPSDAGTVMHIYERYLELGW